MSKVIMEWLPIDDVPIDQWYNDWESKSNCEMLCHRNQTISAYEDVLLTDGVKVWRDYWVFESRGYGDDDIETDYWAIARDSEPRLIPTHYMLFPKPPKAITIDEGKFHFSDAEWKQVDNKTVVEYMEWLICKGYSLDYIYTLMEQLYKLRGN